MVLYDALAEKSYKIVSVSATQEVYSRIINLGFCVGAVIFVVKKATKLSPVLINCNGLNVALGSGISKNIEVSLNE